MNLSLDLSIEPNELVEPEPLWESFAHQVAMCLQNFSCEDFRRAWQTHHNRTAFYGTMIEKVAFGLDMKLIRELRKVDYVLHRRVGDVCVPLIFVECENHTTNAYQEVDKLCWFAAPVGVLITSVEWDPTVGVWDDGGQREHLLAQWQSIVRLYHSVWRRKGYIGILIGEWRPDNVLRFYAVAIDNKGRLLGEGRIIFEMLIPASQT
jgi:hypothetical protein